MKRLRYALAVTTLLLFPALLRAQDFGVMESAETIERGNFKLKANPMFVIQDDDTDVGLVGGVGYGVTDRLDVEFNVAGYDGLSHFGGNAEYWLVKAAKANVSVIGGFHYSNFESIDQTGVDVTLVASHPATPRLDLNAAFDMAFNRFRGNFADDGYNTVHVVPGIEFKVQPDLDLLAEFGVSMNDNGSHYVSVGLAYYLR